MPRQHFTKAPKPIAEKVLTILHYDGPRAAVVECLSLGYDFPDIEANCPLHRRVKELEAMGLPDDARVLASQHSMEWASENQAIAIIETRRAWAKNTSLKDDTTREDAKLAAARADGASRAAAVARRAHEILAEQDQKRQQAAFAAAMKELEEK